MPIAKLQNFLENLPDGLQVTWRQKMEGMFFMVDLEEEFYYKEMCYTHDDLLNLDTLLPILKETVTEDDKNFLYKDIWAILDELEVILDEVSHEDLIVSFGSNVIVSCSNEDLLVEDMFDEEV